MATPRLAVTWSDIWEFCSCCLRTEKAIYHSVEWASALWVGYVTLAERLTSGGNCHGHGPHLTFPGKRWRGLSPGWPSVLPCRLTDERLPDGVGDGWMVKQAKHVLSLGMHMHMHACLCCCMIQQPCCAVPSLESTPHELERSQHCGYTWLFVLDRYSVSSVY
jgi:hypothetical protein